MSKDKQQIIKALQENKKEYGKPYCPCVIPILFTSEQAEDYVCPCKEYRETKHCRCGLYD